MKITFYLTILFILTYISALKCDTCYWTCNRYISKDLESFISSKYITVGNIKVCKCYRNFKNLVKSPVDGNCVIACRNEYSYLTNIKYISGMIMGFVSSLNGKYDYSEASCLCSIEVEPVKMR